MKKNLLLILSLLFIAISYGQTDISCDSVVLNSKTNIKNAEPCVLIAADYVLSHPMHENEQTYHDYRAFILSWMDKTPDYTFSLNSKIVSMCKGDNVLLFGVYTTCLAKAALETKKDFNDEALKLFVEYIKDTDNKVSQSSKIKKLIADFEANKTDEYTK